MVDKPRGRDGFSWLYRVGFRIEYGLMHVMGPPALDPGRDPRHQMKRDHERRRELRRRWQQSRRA